MMIELRSHISIQFDYLNELYSVFKIQFFLFLLYLFDWINMKDWKNLFSGHQSLVLNRSHKDIEKHHRFDSNIYRSNPRNGHFSVSESEDLLTVVLIILPSS